MQKQALTEYTESTENYGGFSVNPVHSVGARLFSPASFGRSNECHETSLGNRLESTVERARR